MLRKERPACSCALRRASTGASTTCDSEILASAAGRGSGDSVTAPPFISCSPEDKDALGDIDYRLESKALHQTLQAALPVHRRAGAGGAAGWPRASSTFPCTSRNWPRT